MELTHVDKAIHEFQEVVKKVHTSKEKVMRNQKDIKEIQS